MGNVVFVVDAAEVGLEAQRSPMRRRQFGVGPVDGQALKTSTKKWR